MAGIGFDCESNGLCTLRDLPLRARAGAGGDDNKSGDFHDYAKALRLLDTRENDLA